MKVRQDKRQNDLAAINFKCEVRFKVSLCLLPTVLIILAFCDSLTTSNAASGGNMESFSGMMSKSGHAIFAAVEAGL